MSEKSTLTAAEAEKEIKSFTKWVYPILIKSGKTHVVEYYKTVARIEKNKVYVKLIKAELEKLLKHPIED